MNSKSFQHEINKGMWLLSPHVLYGYLNDSFKTASTLPTPLNHRDTSATSIMEVVDNDGNYIDFTQQEIPEGSVGIVRCIGPMYKYGSWFHWGSDELVAMATRFDNDPRIVGQVWWDDSGGGSTSSVAPYHNFLKNKKKPVVSLVDTCGSANLWKNSGTDYIMAENDSTSLIGSIGIMATLYNNKKHLEELGVVEHVIESSLSEDKNKAYKLAMEGKYELIREELLDPMARKFQEDIRATRPNLKEVEGVLTGKVFYSPEAVELGLIDGIGNLDAAIDFVKFLASARSLISTNY